MGNTENTLITLWRKLLFPITFSLQRHPYRSDHIEDKMMCKKSSNFFRTKFSVLTVTENLPQYSGVIHLMR